MLLRNRMISPSRQSSPVALMTYREKPTPALCSADPGWPTVLPLNCQRLWPLAVVWTLWAWSIPKPFHYRVPFNGLISHPWLPWGPHPKIHLLRNECFVTPNPSSLPEFTPPLPGLTRSALALHFQYLMFLFKICFSRQRKSGDSCCLLPAILIPVSGRGGHTINASLMNRCMHAWHAYLNI